MRKVIVKIEGISPYSQSRMHDEPKLDKETSNDYESRTWRERCNTDKDGMVVIPAMAFKQALPIACKKIGRQIPGRGKSTYTKYFEGDVLCVADAKLGIHKDDMRKVTINAHANGQRGYAQAVEDVAKKFRHMARAKAYQRKPWADLTPPDFGSMMLEAEREIRALTPSTPAPVTVQEVE